MIVKSVFLFLAFIAVLAMFGKARLLLPKPKGAKRCRACARPLIGKGPCACGARKD